MGYGESACDGFREGCAGFKGAAMAIGRSNARSGPPAAAAGAAPTRSGVPAAARSGRVRRSYSLRVLVLAMVAAFVALAIATTTAAAVVRVLNFQSEDALGDRWLPAQRAAAALEAAWLDQQTGQRGYLLTGEQTSLRPYVAGSRQTQQLTARLRDLLDPAQPAADALDAVTLAGRRWRALAAEPTIAARAQGPLSADQLASHEPEASRLFADVRAGLDSLAERTDVLVRAELHDLTVRQTAANIVAATSLALTLLVAAISVPLLRRAVLSPLDWLVDELQAVAAGRDDRQPIRPTGPTELRHIAVAAEQMRTALVRSSGELVEAQHQITLLDERERIAADLHDHTIQRIFGLGLSMSAAASASPQIGAVVEPMLAETDRIIRELRALIYGIRDTPTAGSITNQLRAVVADSVRPLGFTPELRVEGDPDRIDNPDIVDALLAALRETLSNVARHAHATAVHINLAIDEATLVMRVADNGIGFNPQASSGDGLRNLRARADRLAGTSTITTSRTGTTIEWRVPITSSSEGS